MEVPFSLILEKIRRGESVCGLDTVIPVKMFDDTHPDADRSEEIGDVPTPMRDALIDTTLSDTENLDVTCGRPVWADNGEPVSYADGMMGRARALEVLRAALRHRERQA